MSKYKSYSPIFRMKNRIPTVRIWIPFVTFLFFCSIWMWSIDVQFVPINLNTKKICALMKLHTRLVFLLILSTSSLIFHSFQGDPTILYRGFSSNKPSYEELMYFEGVVIFQNLLFAAWMRELKHFSFMLLSLWLVNSYVIKYPHQGINL